jgi:hypothetical protein
MRDVDTIPLRAQVSGLTKLFFLKKTTINFIILKNNKI